MKTEETKTVKVEQGQSDPKTTTSKSEDAKVEEESKAAQVNATKTTEGAAE